MKYADTRSTYPQSSSAWKWLVVGIILGVAGIMVWRFPAVWLSPQLEKMSHGLIRLEGVEGSIWGGQAYLAIKGKGETESYVLPEVIRWKFRLNAKGFSAELMAPGLWDKSWHINAKLGFWYYRLGFSDNHMSLPVELLSHIDPVWRNLGLSGYAQIETQQFSLTKSSDGAINCVGRVTIKLRRLMAKALGSVPLGSYELATLPGECIRFEVRTKQGLLQLKGAGSFEKERLNFRGQAQLQANAPRSLDEMLSFLGKRENGVVLINVE